MRKLKVGDKVQRRVHGTCMAFTNIKGDKVQQLTLEGTVISINWAHLHYTVDFGNHLFETYYIGAKDNDY